MLTRKLVTSKLCKKLEAGKKKISTPKATEVNLSKVLAFIEYYNRTMAKPFKWTYQGKALKV